MSGIQKYSASQPRDGQGRWSEWSGARETSWRDRTPQDQLGAAGNAALMMGLPGGDAAASRALKQYARDYNGINPALRRGETPATVADLDRAIAAHRTTADLSVFRGRTDRIGAKPGDVLTDPGFISTTLNPGVASGFATPDGTAENSGSIFHIRVPSGTPVARVGGIDTAGEAELLLGRGTRLRVIEAGTVEYGIEVYDVEVVPAEIQKYSPDQARDERGRFTHGVGVDSRVSPGLLSMMGLGPTGAKNAEVAARIGPSDEGWHSAWNTGATYTTSDGEKVWLETETYKPDEMVMAIEGVSETPHYKLAHANSIVEVTTYTTNVDGNPTDHIVGRMQAAQFNSAQAYEIDAIQTDPDYQRVGIATAMLEFARRENSTEIEHSSNLTPSGSHFASVVKYSADQPRDERGRFASLGSSVEVGTGNFEADFTAATGEKFRLKYGYYTNDSGLPPQPDVVKHDANVLAFIEGGPSRVGRLAATGPVGEDAIIATVHVHEQLRRRGLATAMLEMARRHFPGTIVHDRPAMRTDDGMAWSAVVKSDHEYRTGGMEIAKYSPTQPRDGAGRWTSGGGGSFGADSVARGSDGELLGLYHGSTTAFEDFDPATSVRSVDNEWATKQRAKMDTAAGYGGVRYGNPYTEGTPEQEAEWAKHPDVVAHKMGALADLRQQADREAQIAKAQAYVNESPLAIRMHDSTLMLRDGRYKSQFETGTSGGALSPALRADAEADMFGFPVDMPVDQRPAYGYLERATEVGGYMGSGAVSQYGSDRIILKDSVRPRTTITGEDSLGRKFVPAPVNAVDEYALSRRKGDLLAGIKQSQSVNYIEIQVHGGVKVSDVARVDMSLPDYTLRTEGGKRLLEEKRATAAGWEAAGVPAYVNGERVVTVQKYAPGQPRDERGRFSTTAGSVGALAYRSISPDMEYDAAELLSPEDHRDMTAHTMEQITKVHSIPDTGGKLSVVAYGKEGHDTLGGADGFYHPANPGTINVYAGTEEPTYTVTHEFGHLVDFEFVGSSQGSSMTHGVTDHANGGEEFFALQKTINNSDSTVAWNDRALTDSDSYWRYVADPPEVFARAYAQYIGVRSGDPILLNELHGLIETQWEDDEFEPIADAFDKFFTARGMGPETSVQKYSAAQPRDNRGRWTDGGADTAGGSFDVEQLGFRNVTAFGEPLDPRLTASMERITTVHRTPEVMAVPEVYDTNELWLSWDTNMSGEGTLAPNVMGAYEAPADGRKGRIHMNKESLGVGSSDADARMRVYAQHEYGHALDNLALGLGSGKYGSTNIGRRPDMEPLVMAIEATPAFKAIKHDDYYGQRPEAFARAYTQWIATRSGDKAALAWMEPRFDQWSAEEFAPIAAEFDTLFRGRGWLIED